MSNVVKIRTANDQFQMLSALLTNRTKRHRAGQFVVQGVRPITMAVDQGWDVSGLLYSADRSLSQWARQMVATCADATRYELDPSLMAELSQRDEPAELLALVGIRAVSLADLLAADPTVIVALDRPGNPGNVGTILRSCDALGARGLVVVGHACDPFDPQSVRASTGSIFSIPICLVPSFQELRDAHQARAMVAVDEAGTAVEDVDLTAPLTLLFGSETRGLSQAAIAACDQSVAIPMSGTASSLNLSAAVAIVLYEAGRRTRATPG